MPGIYPAVRLFCDVGGTRNRGGPYKQQAPSGAGMRTHNPLAGSDITTFAYHVNGPRESRQATEKAPLEQDGATSMVPSHGRKDEGRQEGMGGGGTARASLENGGTVNDRPHHLAARCSPNDYRLCKLSYRIYSSSQVPSLRNTSPPLATRLVP